MSSNLNHHHHRQINGATVTSPPQALHRCPHLADFRARHGTTHPFRLLQDCLRIKPPCGRAEIRRDPAEIPCCITCGETSRSRLYACVACAAVSCHAPPHESHAAAHSQLMAPGHEIAVDVDRAELFCCACRDQIYDRDFDAAVVLAQTISTNQIGSSSASASSSQPNLSKRRRIVEYLACSPDTNDHIDVSSNSTLLVNGDSESESPPSSSPPWGLRGFNNLGNTCFMNSVLQALMHTPPLRDYFLSDKHNRYYCQKQRKSIINNNGIINAGSNHNSSNLAGLCLACDLDAMFSAVFSGDRSPYSPAKFLYSWWQHAANLASYEQQDAHEFFISMLDRIHEKVEKDKRKAMNIGSGDCCIAHRVFSGILRSDVMCMSCGFTSTTYDPCIDISLDLEPSLGSSSAKSASTKTQHTCNGEADSTKSTQNCGISTLIGCLDRFTRPERLGSDQKFFCQQCKVRQESLKQMSIRKLPLVSCFHIKRFEHSTTRKMSRKVDRYLQFPFTLDMTPYLSSSILRSRYGNRIFPFDDEHNNSNELSSEFELFAVVTHSGKLDAGHYVTYLRLNNQWYKCDDAWVTQVNENIVRAAQCYMMFYVQKMFYYKASEKQSMKFLSSGWRKTVCLMWIVK
ncbi:hypothetical protein ACFE04_009496 [Oxalis oulophora]